MRQREGMPQPREEQVGPQEAQPCAHTRGGGGGSVAREGSGHRGTGVWGAAGQCLLGSVTRSPQGSTVW